MKVLVLTSQVYQLGGAEKLAVELVHGLNSNGVKADLGIMFLSKDPNKNNTAITTEIRKRFQMGNYCDLAIPSNPGIFQIVNSVAKLIRYIRKNKYTHVETSLVTPSIIATIASLVTPIVHIVGFHQSYQPVFMKDIKYKLFFLLAGIAKHNRYYAISNLVADTWRSCSTLSNLEIRTIYNSIDPYFLDNCSSPAGKELFFNKKNVILCVGRVTKQKGYHILFDAIKEELVPRDISIFFLGQKQTETNDEIAEYQRIQDEIRNNGLTEHVFFLGFKENVKEYIANCDLLVHPTAYEGFGLVLIEAMALKKPIITTNVEAIPEILSNTGICQLEYGNRVRLKAAIISFFENNSIYDPSIEKGYKRSAFFSLQSRVGAFLKYAGTEEARATTVIPLVDLLD